jgi:ubiquinone/menaquinone biosynthesis C-methylase UbiE
MVALAQPQAHWHGLDVATGAGHTAYAFAPRVKRMWASDITDEMLELVRGEIAKRGLDNMRVATARAESLPFEDQSLDLVTCRIAPHHFESIPRFLGETHRVLKPGGTLALVDNVVPPGSVGDFVNAFERFRDPSHLRAWTTPEWRDALTRQGFSVLHEEEIPKTMEFGPWAARHDATMQALLRAMLKETTPAVKEFLRPAEPNGGLTFDLLEALFIARRNPAS